jgi:peptide chain release factor subunit 1
VIDELVEVVIDEGGTVEHVRADTPLQEHRVAASLRYPLPLEPGGATLNVRDRGLSELR